MEEVDEFGIPIKKSSKASESLKSANVDEFGIPIKKKVSSDSSSASQKASGVSVQKVGSSDTQQPSAFPKSKSTINIAPGMEYTPPKQSAKKQQKVGSSGLIGTENAFSNKKVPVVDAKKTTPLADSESKPGSLSWNFEKLKEKNPEITERFNQYEQVKQIPEDLVKQKRAEIDAKFNGEGFMNNLKTGIIKVANYIINPVDDVFETDDFAEERAKVAKDIKTNQERARKLKQPIPTYTQAQINEKIKLERLNKELTSEKESRVRSFMDELDQSYTVDDTGLNARERFNIYKNAEQASLGEKDRTNLKQQDIVLPALSSTVAKLTDYAEKVKKGTRLNAAEVQDYQNQFANYQKLEKEAMKLKDEFYSNREKLGSSKEELDLFKRDYGWGRHFKNMYAFAQETSGGIMGAADYAMKWLDTATGEDIFAGSEAQSVVRDVSKELLKDAKKTRESVAKPMEVDSINNWNDLGNWTMDLLSNQAPQVLSMIVAPEIALPMMGTSALGQKYEGMIDEMDASNKQPGEEIKNYNDSQLMLVPAIFGATETASAMVDRYLLKGASRAYNSAAAPERKLVVDGLLTRAFGKTKGFVKSGLIEGADEGFTKWGQNFADIYIGGNKNIRLTDGIKDASIAGTVMGQAMQVPAFVPAIIKETNRFSTDNRLKSVNKEILALELQLDSKALAPQSRKVIQEQLDSNKAKAKTLLEKRVKDISTLSNAQFNEINRLEKSQVNIQNKANEIRKDASINPELKKQILGNLKSEFNANEQRRVDLLQKGAAAQISNLPVEEQIRLKDKAQRKLMKEMNPDGTKTIKLDDDQISKEALNIYKAEQEKVKLKEIEKTPTEQVQNEKKVEQYRSEEQAELREKLPNAEYKADGKIDVNKLSQEDAITYDNIYKKYDKLISPLLEKQKQLNDDTSNDDTSNDDPLKDVESTANALNDDIVSKIEDNINTLFAKDDNTNTRIAEMYHKAKEDGSNPELVKAVENLLNKPTDTQIPVEETTSKFKKSVDLLKDINDADSGTKKRRLAEERRKYLEENPTVKFIDDNIKDIARQLEEKGELIKTGDCL